MADFVFYVGRKGQDSAKCVANVPDAKGLPNFKGGKVEVSTPKGKVEVELSDAFTMLVSSMTIELQNGVRDTLFPKDEQTKDGKASKTGYQG